MHIAVVRGLVIQGKSGCRCAEGWLCWSCKTESYEIANAKRDGEMDWRREMIGGPYALGSLNTYIGLKCRCGGVIEREARVYMCAGCEGLITKPITPDTSWLSARPVR